MTNRRHVRFAWLLILVYLPMLVMVSFHHHNNKVEHKEENKECSCNKERHERYLRHEFYYGNYEQSYTLPDEVERDNISASVADGILTIVIPKTTPEKEAKVMKNIEVK